MPNTYVVRLNYSFTKLNGRPFNATFSAWYQYQSATIDGTFPNQLGQIVGAIYLAPYLFPPSPTNLGQIQSTRGNSLTVTGGKVVAFNGNAEFGPLSMNISESRFDFGYSAGPTPRPAGEGKVKCDDPVKV
jgi:hypothetical protein